MCVPFRDPLRSHINTDSNGLLLTLLLTSLGPHGGAGHRDTFETMVVWLTDSVINALLVALEITEAWGLPQSPASRPMAVS